MSVTKKGYAISGYLESITEREVTILDQENTDGESWDYYCSGQIIKAAVLENTITGSVRELMDEFDIKITVDEHQIYSSCTCGVRDKICKHVISLLYSWISDREAFVDVGKAVEKLSSLENSELINIIRRILEKDPSKVKYVRQFEEQDLEDQADELLAASD